MKFKLTGSYERILTTLTPYIALVSGLLAAWLCTKIGLYSSLGLTQATVAHDIAEALTGLVTAGLVYASNHKWLTNLAVYWHEETARMELDANRLASGAVSPQPSVPEPKRVRSRRVAKDAPQP